MTNKQILNPNPLFHSCRSIFKVFRIVWALWSAPKTGSHFSLEPRLSLIMPLLLLLVEPAHVVSSV